MHVEKISYNTKIILVGNESSGKTSLMNSLLKKNKKASDNCNTSPTNGISIQYIYYKTKWQKEFI